MTAFLRNLTHTCTIRRNSPTRNAIGEWVDNWTNVATGQVCRFMYDKRQGPSAILDEANEQVIYAYVLLLPPNADVTAVDQITNITFEDATQEPGPFSVIKIVKRRMGKRAHSIMLVLERVE